MWKLSRRIFHNKFLYIISSNIHGVDYILNWTLPSGAASRARDVNNTEFNFYLKNKNAK